MGSVNDHIALAVAGSGHINDKLISFFSAPSVASTDVGLVSFAGDLEVSNQAPFPYQSGTFTALSDKVWVDIHVSGAVSGGANANLWFLYAPEGTGVMRTNALFWPTKAAVSQVNVGRMASEGADNIARRFQISGLTPGTYEWQLEYIMLSGYELVTFEATANPTSVVVSADHKKLWVADGNQNKIWPVDLGAYPGYLWDGSGLDSTIGTAIVPTGTASFTTGAITPDGTKAVFTDFFSDRVAVVDTETDTVDAVVQPPASASFPWGIVATSDTEMWVTSNDGDIVPFNPQTAVFGTAVATDAVAKGHVVTDGTFLYFGSIASSPNVYRYPIAGGTLDTWSIAAGNSLGIAVGENLYVGNRLSTIYELDKTDGTQIGTIDTSAQGTDVDHLATSADEGRLIYADLADAGRMAFWSTDIAANSGVVPIYALADRADVGTTGRHIRVTDHDYVILSHDNNISIWPGAKFFVREAQGQNVSEFSEITFQGATIP